MIHYEINRQPKHVPLERDYRNYVIVMDKYVSQWTTKLDMKYRSL